MNKVMRTLTMAGLGLLAGASVGAPALAADSSGTTVKKPTKSQVQQDFGRERVAGFFRTYRACERAGRIGDWAGKWDEYECNPMRFGFRRGAWVLKVERDRFRHFRGHDRHDFRGHDRHFRGDGHDFRGNDGHDFRGNH
ncbi:hypothetical protein [Actinoplanes aureus]|uniref:Uncharacterized protein n=1 Tax=Actinoplanes aureus TaxID=2792083 RepID=A0A931CE69_9ACTN|nr:hypothetical protein [Actinoplanes aureus]MBG0563260.1 hypothetical protein [Actinoplanes aureus]